MCEIEIKSVTGVGPDPESIQVIGTAVDCGDDIENMVSEVIVTLFCNRDDNGEIDQTVPSAEITTPIQGGSWTAIFPILPDTGCTCGGPVVVKARCASDETCESPPFEVRVLECPECPEVSRIGFEPEDSFLRCNADSTVSIKIGVTIKNLTPQDFIAHMELGTNPAGTLDPQGGPGTIGVTSNDTQDLVVIARYPSSTTPQPFVRFTDFQDNPTDCPNIPIPMDPLPECPCAEVTDLKVKDVVGCTATFEGEFNVDPDECDFLWDFGDGSPDMPTSTPEASHDYACDGTYAVAVTVRCGEECLSTTTTLVTIDDCNPCGACCLPDGNCETLSEEECRRRGGTYQGDGTSCDDVECPDDGDGNGNGDGDCWWCNLSCGALLWTGLASIAAAVGLSIAAGCTGAAPLIIAAAIAGALGLFFLGLWAWLCRNFVNCGTLCTIINTVKIAIVVHAIMLIVFALIQNWGCFAGVAAAWGYLGLVLVILLQVNQATNCDCEDSGS